MKLRKVTSLTSLFSFVVLTLTSVILYIVPHGRVAYWADWRLWGMNKEQWGDVHLNVGVLFLVAIGLHVWLNWTPLTAYWKNKARDFRFFTPESNLSLAVCVLFVVGTLAVVPPFSWITELGAHIKDQASLEYGEPPYGHAELSSLEAFAHKTGLDLDAALAALAGAGYAVPGPKAVLQDVARANGVSPKDLWRAMGGGTKDAWKPVTGAPAGLPDVAPPGTGRTTLADLCAAYGLDLAEVLAALRAAGMEAAPDMTLVAVGEASGVHPEAVYAAIRDR